MRIVWLDRSFAIEFESAVISDIIPFEMRPSIWMFLKWSWATTQSPFNPPPPLVAQLVKSTEIGKESHAGQKHQLVARWSKWPICNFQKWDAQNGLKILERDHWRKGLKRNTLMVKIFYFDPSGTMCRGGTLQSAIPALWLQSATPALRIRYRT